MPTITMISACPFCGSAMRINQSGTIGKHAAGAITCPAVGHSANEPLSCYYCNHQQDRSDPHSLELIGVQLNNISVFACPFDYVQALRDRNDHTGPFKDSE